MKTGILSGKLDGEARLPTSGAPSPFRLGRAAQTQKTMNLVRRGEDALVAGGRGIDIRKCSGWPEEGKRRQTKGGRKRIFQKERNRIEKKAHHVLSRKEGIARDGIIKGS